VKRYSSRIIVLLIATLAVFLTACASTVPQTEPIPGTWVDVQVDGDSAKVPLTMVEQHRNLHFDIEYEGSSLAFMAYILDDRIQVRANACPPCRSRGFTLDGNVLDCDACHTLFDARDGTGIEGACVDYPKAAVHYRMTAGNIVMSLADLVDAHNETLIPG